MKSKCAIVFSVIMIVVMSLAGFGEAAAKKSAPQRKKSAPSKPAASQKAPARAKVTSDDIIAEEMLKLAEALRRTSQLEHGIPDSEAKKEKLAAQYDAEIEKTQAEIERLTANIEQLEQKILDLEDKRDDMLNSDSSDDLRIEADLEAAQEQADNISDMLFDSFDITPDYVNPFSPKAASQIVDWVITKDDETEVERLSIAILHNKKTNRLTRLNVTSYLTDSGDIFFKVDNLPEGTQIFVPRDSSKTWTIKADGRVGNKTFTNKGYYVAKIIDPEDIAYSELDGDSSITADGSKTFTSGEAFVILRRSSITIFIR